MKCKFITLQTAAAIMLIAGLVVFLPGCQKDDQNTIRWAIWDYDMTVYYKPLIDAYEAKNPGKKIDVIDLGSAAYMTALQTQLAGRANLDVLSIKDIPGYANLVRQNRLEPLNSFISSAGIDTNVYGGTVEQIAVNNQVFALPFRSDFWVIFYNKDLFDEVGVSYPPNNMTLDDYDVLARRLVRGSGATRTFGAHYHTWRSAVQLFGILDGQNSIVGGNYNFLAPYYDRILKQQDDGIVMPFATIRTSGLHYSGAFFNNQIAMMNMGTWFIATQIDRVKSGEALSKNWGLASYPVPQGVPPGTTLGTITSLAINRDSRKKELALDFLKFVCGPEGASILAKLGTIPAIMNDEVISAISSIDGFPQDENSMEALRITQAYLEMPMHEKSADIELILNEAHENIMMRNTTVEQGIIEMNNRIGRLLGN